ncbi:helix-turn-helix domain-containing protein [Pseudoxanthomonas sangjuensis]|uniref:helix-turn-helix domain-containing protein n=1 Tax=Pseudoxanthomonas sangjuensis TaxID=1503750 RepID=UPI001390A266|nr:AraC family transcriptional regulator [Pseudoxanthomonas sangjuensis]
MNTARRVPVRYLVLLRDWLQAHGVDTVALLRMADIASAKFDQRDAALEPMEVEAFIASARQLTGHSDLGFELGRLIKMTSHDLLGYGMLSCRNIDEVMRLVMRHYHLMTETFSFRYQREPAGAGEVVYAPTIAMPLEMLRFYLETLAVAHDNQLRSMLGGSGGGLDIFVSMPPPPHIARYRALAPTRFHFDEGSLPSVRVVMGPDVLDHPLPFADVHQMREIDRRCEAMGQRPRSTSQDWVEYLRMMIRQSDGQAPTLESIAQSNRVSPRTIDRYLRRENLSFRELLQQVRFERACELLLGSDTTVSQIAVRLGFSDSANFGRAFRRAIGVTPTEYRRRAKERHGGLSS